MTRWLRRLAAALCAAVLLRRSLRTGRPLAYTPPAPRCRCYEPLGDEDQAWIARLVREATLDDWGRR